MTERVTKVNAERSEDFHTAAKPESPCAGKLPAQGLFVFIRYQYSLMPYICCPLVPTTTVLL